MSLRCITYLMPLMLLAGVTPAQELWGELEPGPFDVGFRSEWTFDPARTWDTTFADGSRYAEGGDAPRPLLVNVWYPAASPADPERMSHGGYLEILSEDPRLAQLSVELADYARDVIAEWTLGKPAEEMSAAETGMYERLLAAPTACLRDAPRAQGRFPPVLYHSGYGSSYEDNSVLCEYLASHGYVVVGSAFLAEPGDSFNIDGKAGSARDLAFLMRHMQPSPNVDLEHVGVAGHSGGAHAILRFQAQRRAAVDAAVSLDTTQDYVSALDPHWSHVKPMLDNVAGQRTPLLVVANSHALFQACDVLVHAERTYLTFRDLDHNDYTSQGVFLAENRAQLSGLEPDQRTARNVRRGFTQCSSYVRLFFDAHLKGDDQARATLASLHVDTPLGGAAPHVERVPIGATLPEPYSREGEAPPSPRQLRRLLDDAGAEETLELLTRLREESPEAPIFHSQLLLHLLLDLVARDREADAAVLAPFFAELHPDMGETLAWWVGRSGGEGYREYRIHALTTLLLLRPEDEDVREQLEQEQR